MAYRVVDGGWCPLCARIRHGEQQRDPNGLQRLQAAAALRGGQLLSTEYRLTNSKYRFRCARGHEWATWVPGVLGVASFVPGLSVVTGAVDAGIYAAEGDMVEAGLSAASMIPGGKVVTTAGKLAKGSVGLAKGAHVAEEAAKAAKMAKEAEEAKKAQAEAERLRKLKEEGEAAEKGKDGLKVKLKRMKEHLVKCFKKNAKGDPKEYDRQLLEQEKGLNDLSVKEYLEGRARYQEIGRAGSHIASMR
ncbi:polymorphic toxin type 15 domain-containing protein, partial [Burkholderia cenocepacia]|uniref:polymorphic toxin type 15 domain-containing protein n=1 Tax=Burkholderia cenocepacia TaxID=95486 RepID=UPI002ABDAB6D